MSAATDEKEYRKTWFAWALYDVANSAFYLTIVATVFPIFFQGIYVQAHAGEGISDQDLRVHAGSSLAFTASIAMLIVALLGPILGAIADRGGVKKLLLTLFSAVGIVASGLMYFIGPDDLRFAQVLYIVGTVGVASSIVFYDALLPSIAREGDLDRISVIGFACGYFGSVLLLILNLLWIKNPEWFGPSGAGIAMRLAFISVAVWWAVFTIPLLKRVPEPAPAPGTQRAAGNLITGGFRQLGRTLKKLRNYKQLLLFLAAFWLYNDGIGTFIKLAASFGGMMGVKQNDLILALILTQIVGVPCALAFGWLAKWIGAKRGILLGLAGYAIICVLASFMQKGVAWQFYALAMGVGLVQGGTQALSRSLFASMIPREQAAEFFGFFSTTSKFAGILGPVLLGIVWSQGGNPTRGILWLVVFFVVGGGLLLLVDEKAGQRAAAAATEEGEAAADQEPAAERGEP